MVAINNSISSISFGMSLVRLIGPAEYTKISSSIRIPMPLYSLGTFSSSEATYSHTYIRIIFQGQQIVLLFSTLHIIYIYSEPMTGSVHKIFTIERSSTVLHFSLQKSQVNKTLRQRIYGCQMHIFKGSTLLNLRNCAMALVQRYSFR